MIIKIKGVTSKGKNRVNEHGDEWEVIQNRPHIGQLLKAVKTGYLKWHFITNSDFKEI